MLVMFKSYTLKKLSENFVKMTFGENETIKFSLMSVKT